MSSLQQRLATVTDMLADIAAMGVSLKSQLSELEGLRERVRKAENLPLPKSWNVTALLGHPLKIVLALQNIQVENAEHP